MRGGLLFGKFRRIFKNALIAMITDTHDGGISDAPRRGPWAINDGVPYEYPIAIPAAVFDAGKDAVNAFITEASKEFHYQHGTPYQQGQPVTLPTTDILREWDWQTRRAVLESTHLAWARNPIAKAVVRYNRLFAIGDGVQITYYNDEVRELIEEFIEHPDNQLRQQEKEWLETLQVDGELFFRRFTLDDNNEETGETVITTLPAWGIRAIKHDPGFFRRVDYYDYIIWQSDGDTGGEQFNERIAADQVHHVAINKLSYEQRGRPSLYAILVWLKAHQSLLESLARNIYYTNILYDVTLENATGGQVAAKLQQYKEPGAGAMVAVHNDKEVWQMMQSSRTGAGDIEIVRQLKMQIAAGSQVPEYMLGDGENANLASATAQQTPAFRSFADYQDIMRDLVWTPLLLKWVIEPAIEAGLLDEELPQQDSQGNPVLGTDGSPQMIRAVDAFDVQYQSIEQDDPKTIGEALQLSVMNEWMSNETAAGQMPFEIDYQAEQKKIAAERQKELDEMRSGDRPMPPNMVNGDDANERQERREDEDNQDVP